MSKVIRDVCVLAKAHDGVTAICGFLTWTTKGAEGQPDGHSEVVVALADDQPSGLGWMLNGDLLIVAMRSKRLLRFDSNEISVHADLSELASGFCNDMVVDKIGRAYVGNFGFDIHNNAPRENAEIILVETDGSSRCVNDEVLFPNGTVITPDGRTLIVAETIAGHMPSILRQMVILLIGDQGSTARGRGTRWYLLDAQGGIWSASPSTNNCIRQVEGGEVTHEIALERGAFACMIGDDQLFVLTSTTSHPEKCKTRRDARVEVYPAPHPAAGLP